MLDYDKTHFIDGTDKIDGKSFLEGNTRISHITYIIDEILNNQYLRKNY